MARYSDGEKSPAERHADFLSEPEYHIRPIPGRKIKRPLPPGPRALMAEILEEFKPDLSHALSRRDFDKFNQYKTVEAASFFMTDGVLCYMVEEHALPESGDTISMVQIEEALRTDLGVYTLKHPFKDAYIILQNPEFARKIETANLEKLAK